jgi:hypothetical protein
MTNLNPGDTIECHFTATIEHTQTNPRGEPYVMVRFNSDLPGLWLHSIPGLIVDRVVSP